jgi:hypothetical protein
MRFAGYVIGGWALTGAVIVGYWLWIGHRTRRAAHSDAAPDQRSDEDR